MNSDIGRTHVSATRTLGQRRLTGMRASEEDLRTTGEALLAGRLGEAQALAYLLARPHEEDVMRRWPEERRRLRVAAAALERAETVRGGLRAEAQIAGACGACHARVEGVKRAFERETIVPSDDGTPRAAGQRHRWAAARLIDGVAGGSEVQWRAGLEVFERDLAGSVAHVIASRALDEHVADRAAVYEEMLASCASCHGERGHVIATRTATRTP